MRKIKQGKKPSLAQKKLILKNNLDPKQWRVVFEDDFYLHLVENKPAGDMREIKILDKPQK
ncbi:DUF6906 family protein [Lactonifactor longoviformis]|uniref:DUF6906 family protein n=1 Tax=Lactonifactor longoviformis TaxID=341220 RepID=UPI000933551E|nr:hypothetical protein [Lactonifactor longoviformis]